MIILKFLFTVFLQNSAIAGRISLNQKLLMSKKLLLLHLKNIKIFNLTMVMSKLLGVNCLLSLLFLALQIYKASSAQKQTP